MKILILFSLLIAIGGLAAITLVALGWSSYFAWGITGLAWVILFKELINDTKNRD